MIVLGLTGSIAMGKTTVARQFKFLGVPVLDSDKVVHRLLANDAGAIARIKALFPSAYRQGTIDRIALGKEVFGKEKRLAALESVLHPLVRREQDIFLRRQKRAGKPVVVLDIPLLFETDGQERCDHTIAVSAPAFLQAQRVLRRSGMSREKLSAILSRQMPDSEKRRRADFVILTGLGKRESLRQVRNILQRIRKKKVIPPETKTKQSTLRAPLPALIME